MRWSMVLILNIKKLPLIFISKQQNFLDYNRKNALLLDAINGVEAAKKAGAKCLALTTSFSEEDLKGADWICKDLAHVPSEVPEW